MPEAPSDRALYTLALLSIACSHQSVGDETISQAEIDEASELVRRYRSSATAAEIGAVLAKSMEIYKSIGSEADTARRANACAQLVKREFPAEMLQGILTDLRSIVAADGIVSETEGEFLDTVRRAFASP